MTAQASQSSIIGGLLDGRYRVVREIGRGGMGVVYEAEHVEIGKRVAIKLMLEKYADDKEAVARFRREALAASRIGNPHIIDVSNFGTAPDGRAYVVMELLIGQPLSDVLARGAVAPARAISIMRQVLRAIGAAHAKGIIHRDLKPDNIFLIDHDGDDFVKLLDFGISKILDGEAAVAATKLTTTGMVMGTPLYMAPEQAMGAAIDHHADLYACGVILYEMLSGRPPFEGATFAALIGKMLTTDPVNLGQLQPHLPAKLINATHRALQKEPENRFDSAAEFVSALPMVDRSASSVELAGTVGVGGGSQSLQVAVAMDSVRRTAAPPPKRRVWPWIAGGVVVAGAVVAAVYATTHAGSTATGKTAGSAVALDSGSAAQPAVTPIATAGSAAAASATGSATSSAIATPPAKTQFELKSTPKGAKVTIDHEPARLMPCTVEVAPGPHHLHVELAGFAPMDEDEDVEAGTKDTMLFPLQRASAVVRNVAQVQHNVQKTPATTATTPATPVTPQSTVPVKPAGPTGTDSGDTKPKPNPYDTKPNPY